MLNFDHIDSCYGCGLCAVVCPENIISMELSHEGLYIPVISDKSKCTDCRLCEKVCSYIDGEIAQCPAEIKGYEVYSNDSGIRETCSSGGIGFEIAKLLIENSYKACGVRYSCQNHRAEHFIATTVSDFEESKGSKYLQSYTLDGFKELNKNDKWLVFGSPCQIDSLRRWTKLKGLDDNYILIDFFCHGVPSYYLWNSYIAFSKSKYNFRSIDQVIFRDKRYGHGKDSFAMGLKAAGKEVVSKLKDGDSFYKLFLGNFCLNASCYDKCKFKNRQSSADIRIGDSWSKASLDSSVGVSAVFANTKKGDSVIQQLKKACHIEDKPLDIVSEGQMRKTLEMPYLRTKVLRDLSRGKSLASICLYLRIHGKIKQLFLRVTKIFK